MEKEWDETLKTLQKEFEDASNSYIDACKNKSHLACTMAFARLMSALKKLHAHWNQRPK